MSDPAPPRSGLLAAGNFITDHVKVIDAFPDQDMLVHILSETVSNGGGPYNVLVDLANLGAPFPLAAAGLVGDDEDGHRIRQDCADRGIDASGLRTSDAPTSYTDAMTVADTGRRTFFHHRGANARLYPEAVDLAGSRAKIFYLGYLMLLDTLDALRPDATTGASVLLAAASTAGFITVADLVSIAHPEFRRRVLPALPHIDYLFLNEREAALVLEADAPLPDDAAAEAILALGVRKAVILHTAAGATVLTAEGTRIAQPSIAVPAAEIAGATGAGDAFSAGFLYALHDDQPLADALRLALATAAASLRAPDPSSAILTADECLSLSLRAAPHPPQSPGGCLTT
ncbi:carbohydrate kinase family protein [soil metagenome]